MIEDCTHAWACPNAIPLQQEGGLAIFLPLYCQRCGTAKTLLAPPPEAAPASKITRAQLVPQPLKSPARR